MSMTLADSREAANVVEVLVAVNVLQNTSLSFLNNKRQVLVIVCDESCLQVHVILRNSASLLGSE